jgi:putative tryptophan/tyrosine transport system substrate-binding protein
MKRRSLLAAPLLAAGPAAAQPRPRRIMLILAGDEADADAQGRAAALREGLRALGWVEGRGITIDERWGAGDAARAEAHASEAARLAPDVVVSNGTLQLIALLRQSRPLPIVFVAVTDPVGGGFVRSMARPGGHVTGFASYEPALGGKWVDLLREFAPGLGRVAVLGDARLPGLSDIAAVIEARARALGMAADRLAFLHASDPIEARIAAFARQGEGGVVVLPTAPNLLARGRLVAAIGAARLPAIYPFRPYVEAGGLMSYGPEPLDLFRRAAGHVDRILRGENPGDLPVQLPTRFEFFLNRSVARRMELDFSDMLLARADEVIE